MSCGETWPTPAASQRGEDYTAYLRKCINRVKSGGAPFAPTLQVSAENPKAETSLFKDLDLTKDTEQLIKEIKGRGWPTPKALEIDESVEQWQKRREKPASKMRGPSLTVAVKIEEGNWATPRAGKTTTENLDTRMKRHRQGSVATMPLPLQASVNWATPTTRDWKGAYSEESQKNKPRNLLPDQVKAETVLDPLFVYLVALLKNENPKKTPTIHILLLKKNLKLEKVRKDYNNKDSVESYIERVLNA